MNIESQDGEVHAAYKTDRAGYYIRLVCEGSCNVEHWHGNVTVTDRPVNCAACRRRLERQAGSTPCQCWIGCDRTIVEKEATG